MWVLSCCAVLSAFCITYLNDFGPFDTYKMFLTSQFISNASKADTFFSDSYHSARKLFREKARKANAILSSHPIDVPDMDLTIDIAVVKRSERKVLIHISGTHGVEGFAGSAIQSALLDEEEYKSTKNTNGPTIIMVHALNPYGFANLRRFNERNVDLNRNFLTKEEFETMLNKDSNANGYMDIFDFLNPVDGVSYFWLKALRNIILHGFSKLKRAVVSGNYQFPRSLYYGGSEKQQSLVILDEFIKSHIDLTVLEMIGVIDVHTGLGDSGIDSLYLLNTNAHSAAAQLIKEYEDGNRYYTQQHPNAKAFQGYEDVVGGVAEGLLNLFKQHTKGLYMVQEFGTVPSPIVLKAMIEENMMYHYYPFLRLQYGEKLRDVFYLHGSPSWKKNIIERGAILFDEVYKCVGQ